VEHHDRRPAAGRRHAVGLDEPAGERRAVRGDERDLLRRRRCERRAAEGERDDQYGEEPDPSHDGRQGSPVRKITAMDSRPIGVFDSGVGGLTVLTSAS
jgi:hypothetical protein